MIPPPQAKAFAVNWLHPPTSPRPPHTPSQLLPDTPPGPHHTSISVVPLEFSPLPPSLTPRAVGPPSAQKRRVKRLRRRIRLTRLTPPFRRRGFAHSCKISRKWVRHKLLTNNSLIFDTAKNLLPFCHRGPSVSIRRAPYAKSPRSVEQDKSPIQETNSNKGSRRICADLLSDSSALSDTRALVFFSLRVGPA